MPMDNRFIDYWGIMEYFLGHEARMSKLRVAIGRQRGSRWQSGVGELGATEGRYADLRVDL